MKKLKYIILAGLLLSGFYSVSMADMDGMDSDYNPTVYGSGTSEAMTTPAQQADRTATRVRSSATRMTDEAGRTATRVGRTATRMGAAAERAESSDYSSDRM